MFTLRLPMVFMFSIQHSTLFIAHAPHTSPLTLGKSWIGYIGGTLDYNRTSSTFPMSFGRVSIGNDSSPDYSQNITRWYAHGCPPIHFTNEEYTMTMYTLHHNGSFCDPTHTIAYQVSNASPVGFDQYNDDLLDNVT